MLNSASFVCVCVCVGGRVLDTIVSQLHQSCHRPPASPNQNLAKAITGIFDPLELTQTQTQLGSLAVNGRLQVWSQCKYMATVINAKKRTQQKCSLNTFNVFMLAGLNIWKAGNTLCTYKTLLLMYILYCNIHTIGVCNNLFIFCLSCLTWCNIYLDMGTVKHGISTWEFCPNIILLRDDNSKQA